MTINYTSDNERVSKACQSLKTSNHTLHPVAYSDVISSKKHKSAFYAEHVFPFSVFSTKTQAELERATRQK